MSSPNPIASQLANQSLEQGQPPVTRPESRPRSSRVFLCLPLAVFPAFVMAKAASPRRGSLRHVVALVVFSALYVGGIACFTLSSTVHDSVLITSTGDPITATPLVFLLAWALYVTNPFATIFVDLCIWLRWDLRGLNDDVDKKYHANDVSVALIVCHLVCQIILTIMMMIQSRMVKSDAWDPSWCGVCCCGCCCPHWWLASALASEKKEQRSHDELPAYNA